jgi:hypothetical protein
MVNKVNMVNVDQTEMFPERIFLTPPWPMTTAF